ncbi:MAG: hypothetical protein JSR17_10260 [Proteobacteria bacterium]|nr:hypothetical protein [Pseudomonadota bacterium]
MLEPSLGKNSNKIESLLENAEKALDENNFEQAILSLQEVVKLKKSNGVIGAQLADAYYDLASAHHELSYASETEEKKHLQKALKYVNKALSGYYTTPDDCLDDIKECNKLIVLIEKNLAEQQRVKKRAKKSQSSKKRSKQSNDPAPVQEERPLEPPTLVHEHLPPLELFNSERLNVQLDFAYPEQNYLPQFALTNNRGTYSLEENADAADKQGMSKHLFNP